MLNTPRRQHLFSCYKINMLPKRTYLLERAESVFTEGSFISVLVFVYPVSALSQLVRRQTTQISDVQGSITFETYLANIFLAFPFPSTASVV
jgi:hypothetical protein